MKERIDTSTNYFFSYKDTVLTQVFMEIIWYIKKEQYTHKSKEKEIYSPSIFILSANISNKK
jgi:hypothetical protein